MIESLHVSRPCWRRANRETQSGLQITWHDGDACNGPKQPGTVARHAIVVGQPLRARLVNDCSGGKVKAVETVRCLYTADGVEAEAAYDEMVRYAHQRGRRAKPNPSKTLPGPQPMAWLGGDR